MIQDNTAKWRKKKLSNFAPNNALPVGFMYQHLSSAIPLGSLPLFGGEYDRTLYADLWSWANENGIVVSEAEWQESASATGGSCSKFSDGNGSTTFRVPALKCWVKGANGVEEVGSYLEAGVPNITGTMKGADTATQDFADSITCDGVFKRLDDSYSRAANSNTQDYRNYLLGVDFNASRSNPIYGNSDTVQPPSIVAMYCIVAYGTVTNIGNVDIEHFINDLEQLKVAGGGGGSVSPHTANALCECFYSYLKHNDTWVYSTTSERMLKTATDYEESDEVVVANQSIDCSTLTALLIGGVHYDQSRYVQGNTMNKFFSMGYGYDFYGGADYTSRIARGACHQAELLYKRGFALPLMREDGSVDWSKLKCGDIVFYGYPVSEENPKNVSFADAHIHHVEVVLSNVNGSVLMANGGHCPIDVREAGFTNSNDTYAIAMRVPLGDAVSEPQGIEFEGTPYDSNGGDIIYPRAMGAFYKGKSIIKYEPLVCDAEVYCKTEGGIIQLSVAHLMDDGNYVFRNTLGNNSTYVIKSGDVGKTIKVKLTGFAVDNYENSYVCVTTANAGHIVAFKSCSPASCFVSNKNTYKWNYALATTRDADKRALDLASDGELHFFDGYKILQGDARVFYIDKDTRYTVDAKQNITWQRFDGEWYPMHIHLKCQDYTTLAPKLCIPPVGKWTTFIIDLTSRNAFADDDNIHSTSVYQAFADANGIKNACSIKGWINNEENGSSMVSAFITSLTTVDLKQTKVIYDFATKTWSKVNDFGLDSNSHLLLPNGSEFWIA